MFLYKLDNEQKTYFLELANKIVSSDGINDKSENSMLDQFKAEMRFEELGDYKIKNTPVDKICKKITDKNVQKIFIFELLALGFVDGEVSENEVNFIKNMMREFGMDMKLYHEFLILFIDYVHVYRDGNELITR